MLMSTGVPGPLLCITLRTQTVTLVPTGIVAGAGLVQAPPPPGVPTAWLTIFRSVLMAASAVEAPLPRRPPRTKSEATTGKTRNARANRDWSLGMLHPPRKPLPATEFCTIHRGGFQALLPANYCLFDLPAFGRA